MSDTASSLIQICVRLGVQIYAPHGTSIWCRAKAFKGLRHPRHTVCPLHCRALCVLGTMYCQSIDKIHRNVYSTDSRESRKAKTRDHWRWRIRLAYPLSFLMFSSSFLQFSVIGYKFGMHDNCLSRAPWIWSSIYT